MCSFTRCWSMWPLGSQGEGLCALENSIQTSPHERSQGSQCFQETLHVCLALSSNEGLNFAAGVVGKQSGGHVHNQAPILCRRRGQPGISESKGWSDSHASSMPMRQHDCECCQMTTLSSLALQSWITPSLAFQHVDGQVDGAEMWMGSVEILELLVQECHPLSM